MSITWSGEAGSGTAHVQEQLAIAFLGFLLQALTWCLACYHLEKESYSPLQVLPPTPRHVEDSS